MSISPSALYQSLVEDLAEHVDPSDLKGEAYPDCSIKEFACFSIAKSFLKKLQVKNDDVADSRCLLKFLECNALCEQWSLRLESSWDEILIGEFARLIDDFFHPGGLPMDVEYGTIFANAKVGPGSAIGARGGSFYAKLFSSSLTATSRHLYDEYRRYTYNFPDWHLAEILRTRRHGEVDVVQGNRMSFVPKYATISRSICVEPILNGFAQLGLAEILNRRLFQVYGIDPEVQAFKNRELARIGSETGQYFTIDLESASDSISHSMVRRFFPGWFVELLEELRCPITETEIGPVVQHMISTMGNGFTFPLQTIIFASVVTACARARGHTLERPHNSLGTFGVFGDDIVGPEFLWRDVNRLLKLLGFQVNSSKSFVEGPFRESCGHDYFRGVNVRGIYVKTLDTMQDRFAVINGLNQFSTRTGILLRRTCQALLKTVRNSYIPRSEDASFGIQIPFSMHPDPKFDRWVKSPVYWVLEPLPYLIRITEDAFVVPRGVRSLSYNPPGLLVSFLQRSVNSCALSVRHDRHRYRRKRRVIPFWDAPQAVHPLDRGWVDGQRWNTVVYFNLIS